MEPRGASASIEQHRTASIEKLYQHRGASNGFERRFEKAFERCFRKRFDAVNREDLREKLRAGLGVEVEELRRVSKIFEEP